MKEKIIGALGPSCWVVGASIMPMYGLFAGILVAVAFWAIWRFTYLRMYPEEKPEE